MILQQIIDKKKIEVAKRKATKSIDSLEKETFFGRQCISLKQNLLQSQTGIISEFKRKSPSKGWINPNATAKTITKGYCEVGASGISILTDEIFFGGTPADLISSRPYVSCPILRKDFIIDEYQLIEAKAFGADIILLIAAALTPSEVEILAKNAHVLGLEVLLEIHNSDELAHINDNIDIVGVNNRNLKTFEVDIQTSIQLASQIPEQFVKISESGLSLPETLITLRSYGFKGFLIGENFMKTDNPPVALKKFMSEL